MTTQSKSVVASVVAALFAVAALNVYAADQVRSAGASDKPGRALEEGTVKSGGASSRPARAVDHGVVRTSKNKKLHDRAIAGGAVKSQGTSDKTSRAADQPSK